MSRTILRRPTSPSVASAADVMGTTDPDKLHQYDAARQRWRKTHTELITISIQAGKRETYHKLARSRGSSLSRMVVDYLEKKLALVSKYQNIIPADHQRRYITGLSGSRREKLNVRVPIGKREQYKKLAHDGGVSLSALIQDYLDRECDKAGI